MDPCIHLVTYFHEYFHILCIGIRGLRVIALPCTYRKHVPEGTVFITGCACTPQNAFSHKDQLEIADLVYVTYILCVQPGRSCGYVL